MSREDQAQFWIDSMLVARAVASVVHPPSELRRITVAGFLAATAGSVSCVSGTRLPVL